ncbi:MAG: hypothetical protein IKP95_11680 [Ruminococcus sp.]|nr:hypothetical protein [Ruminococcus sp.]
MSGFFLTKKECAECRQCCTFDGCDLLLTPLITSETRAKIEELIPGARFIHHGGSYLLRLEPDSEGRYPCSLLDQSRGCIMGEEKPFECRIWPLRVMKDSGELMITLSPDCPAAKQKPREDILSTAEELAGEIFAEAKKHPELIKPYDERYEVLVRE